MKPVKIITSQCPAGHFPVEFPEHTGIEPFTLPIIPLIDRQTMKKNNDWLEEENKRREAANDKAKNDAEKQRPVTNYEAMENMFPLVVGKDISEKVMERADGERIQLWDAWLEAAIDTDADLGE